MLYSPAKIQAEAYAVNSIRSRAFSVLSIAVSPVFVAHHLSASGSGIAVLAAAGERQVLPWQQTHDCAAANRRLGPQAEILAMRQFLALLSIQWSRRGTDDGARPRRPRL